jgi:hypothetical protein
MAYEMTKFEARKLEIEYLECAAKELYRRRDDITKEYKPTGEKTEKTKWDRELDKRVPVLDEDGNPVLEDVYDFLPKEKLDDEDKAKLQVLNGIIKKIEAMI